MIFFEKMQAAQQAQMQAYQAQMQAQQVQMQAMQETQAAQAKLSMETQLQMLKVMTALADKILCLCDLLVYDCV